MNTTITGKNFRTYDRLNNTIEKKLDRLGKYFSDDINANVVLSQEKGNDKIEVTINAKGALFRAEEVTDDIYEGIDLVVDKLANQMTKFKGKLQKRYNDNKALKFEFMEDPVFDDEDEEEEAEQTHVVRTKTFDLRPMDVEEAILEMEMLQHDFFVFLNMDTESVNVVYKRKGNTYGLLEPRY
ncbi:MAG: ribosome-associated translation inhibitor RaiA [Eubacterium sp.]|nr:ribosome-associated translation inhibitor RaiA [Eubacterium sp.]